MPLLPALRQICEFKAILLYKTSSRIAKTTQKNPILKNQIITAIIIIRENYRKV